VDPEEERSVLSTGGGGSICEHSRIRSVCKECKGGSICEHSRIRSACKDCKSTSVHGFPKQTLLGKKRKNDSIATEFPETKRQKILPDTPIVPRDISSKSDDSITEDEQSWCEIDLNEY